MARVSRKNVKKAAAHRKRLGFNAFGAQASSAKTTGNSSKLAKCREVQPPETGIHSLAWAEAILPQKSGLLQLPVEVRHRIWNTVIEGYGTRRVKPMKKGNIFYSSNWQNAASDTVSLSETCRLIYVDVVGGSLFYKAKVFSFTPGLMLNYLWVINPVHKNSIRSIQLQININPGSFSPPSKAFAMLTKCKGLQDLYLTFQVSSSLCRVVGSIPLSQKPVYNGRYYPLRELTKIRNCKALQQIKALKSLEVEFWSGNFVYSLNRTASGSSHWKIWRKIHLSAGNTGPYCEVVKEVKQIMLGHNFSDSKTWGPEGMQSEAPDREI